MEFLQGLSKERSVEVQLVLGVGAEKSLEEEELIFWTSSWLRNSGFIKRKGEEEGGRDEAQRPPEGRMEISQSFVRLLNRFSYV